MSGTVAGDVRGGPDLDATLSDNSVTPGEDTTLEVTLSNAGRVIEANPQNPSLTDRVTAARSLTAEMASGFAPIEVRTGKQAVGTLSDDRSATVSFDISVDDDADPGTYRVPVEVEYTDTIYIDEDDGDEAELTRRETLYVSLEIEAGAQVSVLNVSTQSRVGSTGEATITVKNTGTATASETKLNVESLNSGLEFGDSTTASRTLGDWQPGETRNISYGVSISDEASPHPYSVDLTAIYRDENGIRTTSETRSIAIRPNPEQSFVISDVSSNLSVGAEGTLRGTVVNTGKATVSNGVVQFVSDKETVTPLETDSPVGELEPGQSSQFAIPLEISESAEAGDKQYTLSVRYRDQDGDERVSDTFDVVQAVGPDDPEFALSTNGTTITAGETTEIEVTVRNNGNERLTDISANVFADDPVGTVDDEAFISSLEPGESTVVTFSVSASGGALAKDYPLSIDFQYDKPNGDSKISDTYKIPLSVQQPDDDGGLPIGLILVGVVLVVVLGVVYRRYR